jgi:hypothetical protein
VTQEFHNHGCSLLTKCKFVKVSWREHSRKKHHFVFTE